MCLLSDFEPAGLLLFIPWRAVPSAALDQAITGNKGTFSVFAIATDTLIALP